MEEPRSWQDNEVDFIPRESQQVVQDGHLKEDGSEVRKCDGCHVWKLVDEFPTKRKHFAIWFCNYCHGFPSVPKKPKKGETFSRYNEYVLECQRIQEELLRIRNEYMRQKEVLLAEKRQLNRNYRENR